MHSGVANREDRDMYKVMAYLTIFRMEELGFVSYRWGSIALIRTLS